MICCVEAGGFSNMVCSPDQPPAASSTLAEKAAPARYGKSSWSFSTSGHFVQFLAAVDVSEQQSRVEIGQVRGSWCRNRAADSRSWRSWPSLPARRRARTPASSLSLAALDHCSMWKFWSWSACVSSCAMMTRCSAGSVEAAMKNSSAFGIVHSGDLFGQQVEQLLLERIVLRKQPQRLQRANVGVAVWRCPGLRACCAPGSRESPPSCARFA